MPKKSTPNQTKHDMFFTNKQDQHQQKPQHQSNLTNHPPSLRQKNKAQSIRGSFFKANTWDREVRRHKPVDMYNKIKPFLSGGIRRKGNFGGECRLRSWESVPLFNVFWLQNIHNELRKTHRRLSIFSVVGGFNPFEKYARQNGNLPQIGSKKKNIWNHHLVFVCFPQTSTAAPAPFKRLRADSECKVSSADETWAFFRKEIWMDFWNIFNGQQKGSL